MLNDIDDCFFNGHFLKNKYLLFREIISRLYKKNNTPVSLELSYQTAFFSSSDST